MSNTSMSLRLDDGGLWSLHSEEKTSKELIETICGDDFSAPPSFLDINVRTKTGSVVTVRIPYDPIDGATVLVDGQEV